MDAKDQRTLPAGSTAADVAWVFQNESDGPQTRSGQRIEVLYKKSPSPISDGYHLLYVGSLLCECPCVGFAFGLFFVCVVDEAELFEAGE
jgi:hypothetical protein